MNGEHQRQLRFARDSRSKSLQENGSNVLEQSQSGHIGLAGARNSRNEVERQNSSIVLFPQQDIVSMERDFASRNWMRTMIPSRNRTELRVGAPFESLQRE